MPEGIGGSGVNQASRTLLRGGPVESGAELLDGAAQGGDLLLEPPEPPGVPGLHALDLAVELLEDQVGALQDLAGDALVEAPTAGGQALLEIVESGPAVGQLQRDGADESLGGPAAADAGHHAGGEETDGEVAEAHRRRV